MQKKNRTFSLNNKEIQNRILNYDLLAPNCLRNDIQKALKKNKIIKQKGNYFSKKVNLNPTKINYIKHFHKDPSSIIERVKDFNKTYDDNLRVFRELREENNLFVNKYSQTKKLSEGKKIRRAIRIGKVVETPFSDLISKYTHKKYKTPNLTVENNLFQPSSLLMENNKISEYYNLAEYMNAFSGNDKFKRHYDKDSFYLHNLNARVNEILIKDEDKRKQTYEKIKTVRKKISQMYLKTEEQLREENELILIDNEKMKNCMLERENKKKQKLKLNLLKKNNPKDVQLTEFSLMVERPISGSQDVFENFDINAALNKINTTQEKYSNNLDLNNLNNINSTQGSFIFNINNTTTTGFDTFYGATQVDTNIPKTTSKQIKYKKIFLNVGDKIKSSVSLYKLRNESENKNTTQICASKKKHFTSIYSNSSTKKNIEILNDFSFSRIHSSSNSKVPLRNRNKDSVHSFNSLKVQRSINVISEDKLQAQPDETPNPKIEKLEEIYDKLHRKEYSNIEFDIHNYFTNYTKKKKSSLEKQENIGPNELLKNIGDIKSKVSYTDILDIYKNFTAKNGMLKIDTDQLIKVNKLDGKIMNLDLLLVKELRKNKKG